METRLIIGFMALVLLIAMPIASAEALMVTVAQDSGTVSIKHVEMISSVASEGANEGPYILAYETDTEIVTITAFDIPAFSMAKNIEPLAHSERTLIVPTLPEAKNISIYNVSGDMLAYFSLSGISKVGDAKGTPPEGSIAAQTGQTSVAKALAESEGRTSTTGTETKGTTTGNQTGTATTGQQTGTTGTESKPSGLCLITYAVPALGAAAAYRKFRKPRKS